jgi:hypothetical protein
VSEPPLLPRRRDDIRPGWREPDKPEFPRWRAWYDRRQFWALLPGTTRVCHADEPARLANQIRASNPSGDT